MDELLFGLKHNYFAVPVVVLIALVFMYVEGRINDENYSKKQFIKVSILVGVICIFMIHIHSLEGFNNEEILAGPANF